MNVRKDIKIEKNMDISVYLGKIMILTLGNIIAAIGVTLCILAGKGVDPLTLLFQGVCNLTGLEIGTVSLGVNVVLLFICFLIERSSVKLGTIISMFTFSTFLNFFIHHMGIALSSDIEFLSWIYLACGIIFMGIGFSTCIFAGIGPNCLDVVLELLIKKTRRSMKTCKIIVDCISAIIGILLGARLGIGTILCVIFVGMVYTLTSQFFTSIIMKTKYIDGYNVPNKYETNL